MFPTPLKAQENSKMKIDEEEKSNQSKDSEMKDEEPKSEISEQEKTINSEQPKGRQPISSVISSRFSFKTIVKNDQIIQNWFQKDPKKQPKNYLPIFFNNSSQRKVIKEKLYQPIGDGKNGERIVTIFNTPGSGKTALIKSMSDDMKVVDNSLNTTNIFVIQFTPAEVIDLTYGGIIKLILLLFKTPNLLPQNRHFIYEKNLHCRKLLDDFQGFKNVETAIVELQELLKNADQEEPKSVIVFIDEYTSNSLPEFINSIKAIPNLLYVFAGTSHNGTIPGFSGIGKEFITRINCSFFRTLDVSALLQAFFDFDQDQMKHIELLITPEIVGRPYFASAFLRAARELLERDFDSFEQACQEALKLAHQIFKNKLKSPGKFETEIMTNIGNKFLDLLLSPENYGASWNDKGEIVFESPVPKEFTELQNLGLLWFSEERKCTPERFVITGLKSVDYSGIHEDLRLKVPQSFLRYLEGIIGLCHSAATTKGKVFETLIGYLLSDPTSELFKKTYNLLNISPNSNFHYFHTCSRTNKDINCFISGKKTMSTDEICAMVVRDGSSGDTIGTKLDLLVPLKEEETGKPKFLIVQTKFDENTARMKKEFKEFCTSCKSWGKNAFLFVSKIGTFKTPENLDGKLLTISGGELKRILTLDLPFFDTTTIDLITSAATTEVALQSVIAKLKALGPNKPGARLFSQAFGEEEKNQPQQQKKPELNPIWNWISEKFTFLNEQQIAELKISITKHCQMIDQEKTKTDLNELFDALNDQKDPVTGKNLNLGTIDNLLKLINNKITSANQFTSLFDALNDPSRKLGTIENFLLLNSYGVVDLKDLKLLIPEIIKEIEDMKIEEKKKFLRLKLFLEDFKTKQ